MDRNQRWQSIYAGIVYDVNENPPVLRNKLNIRDYQELEIFERQIVSERLHQGLPESALQQNPSGLKELHRHLFQDVYSWAGEYRPYPTARNPNASFSLPDYIETHSEITFKKLAEEKFLKNLSPAKFAERAALYVNEINAIHPFIDGNGRVQRIWLRNTANAAGYLIDFKSQDRKHWNQMSMLGQVTADNPEKGYMANDPMRDFLRSKLKGQGAEASMPEDLHVKIKKYEKAAEKITANQRRVRRHVQ